MEITERICLECGKTFKARGENFMCQPCIKKVLRNDEEPEKAEKEDEGFTYIYKPRKKKSQIDIDAKKAAELGISYGQYMADKRSGWK